MNETMPFSGETPDNYTTRCLCVLVLDTSGSMGGGPIAELNKGLQGYADFLKSKNSTRFSVETSIITFDSEVNCIQEPALIDDMETLHSNTLQATGATMLNAGMKLAIQKVSDRKQWYRNNGISYYRPWVVLITDGSPTDGGGGELAQEISLAHNEKKFAFLPMGVQGANERFLSEIASEEFPPLPIDWNKFEEVFKWLSNSLDKVSQSSEGEQIKFDPVSDFSRTGWGGGDFTQTPL